ncbi:MAG: hypothetical protein NTX75_05545 [Proteobacteria bacterium]|nr:hypothetical protein [Pseudomonadota bacterium]
MKTKVFLGSTLIIALLLITVSVFAEGKELRTATGEVVLIDEKGKAILVKIVVGKTEYINGGIVNDDTRITAGGKDATINDIKVKDRVTMVLKMENNEVYVKKITKK